MSSSDSPPAVLGLAELSQRIGSSPFHGWLGLTAESIDADGVTLILAPRRELIGNPRTGALQGGVLGCMIDAAASFSIISRTGASNVTIDMSVDFHRAALLGAVDGRLRAVGTVTRIGRTISTAQARVLDGGGALIASGRAVFKNTEAAMKSAEPG